jgi:hypothetical protein
MFPRRAFLLGRRGTFTQRRTRRLQHDDAQLTAENAVIVAAGKSTGNLPEWIPEDNPSQTVGFSAWVFWGREQAGGTLVESRLGHG